MREMRNALQRVPTERKRATNVSLNASLLEEAKSLGVKISQACERGLEEEIRKRRVEAWLKETQEAIDSSNKFVEENGIPLSRYRNF